MPSFEALHLAEDDAVRLPATAEEQEHGEDHGDDDPWQDPEHDDAQAGDHREDQGALSHPVVPDEGLEIQQRERRGDQDGGQGGLGKVGQKRVEEQ